MINTQELLGGVQARPGVQMTAALALAPSHTSSEHTAWLFTWQGGERYDLQLT